MRRFRPVFALFCFLSVLAVPAVHAARTDQLLTDNWLTTLAPADSDSYAQPTYTPSDWKTVSVPHNHDTYQGYRQLRHGNLHGTAWYRRSFTVTKAEQERRIFLFFEGVGSYATVWVNGQQVGQHAGGLTTFTIDITDAVRFDHDNILTVRADHPAGIRDLPWVCGGCERASGFSEGPQPLGIFRPVHLVATKQTRIEPFGVHAWIDGPQADSVGTSVETELKNYSASTPSQIALRTRLLDRNGNKVVETTSPLRLATQQSATIKQTLPAVASLHLWSPTDPYLYTLVSEILVNGEPVDRVETPFGFRWISWPKTANPDRRRLLVNGQPFFLNGTADYEHQLGNNFAFTDTQISARVRQIEAAGFNAFRDAHHPHNLRFQRYWDRDGLLWWTQFGAHVWFDNATFRANYKALLRDWVKERRNSPSLILWGLQNESQLPTEFAEECSAIVRELDPTASTQRLITTCNNGTGTDWNVPQNWSGTYSGDPEKYDEDLRSQSLVGEYGAWRSLDLHTEGRFESKGPLSENRLCDLMETKIRLAEKAQADSCGQFQWPFTSHANPGRNFGENGEQLYDGIRPLDRVGPVNNKGLFTIWGEPTDAFYLYRANFAPKETQPMVYIVSHTWPDRWTTPGKKSGIVVYSNCDEVELFNGLSSLGRRTQAGRGTHFQWDDVEIENNELRAIAYVAGKFVASDEIRLNHLPAVPRLKNMVPDWTVGIHDQHYLYRVNCGGPAYTDRHGNLWLADRAYTPGDSWGAVSWADEYESLPTEFASQRKIHAPISGAYEEPLFQTYRFGREIFSYRFAVPEGEYIVDLFFAEPWYGVGGSMDCTGWRVFDVAINGAVVLRDFDLWREAPRFGSDIKTTVTARSVNGTLTISFPKVTAGQAVISAIAISSKTELPLPNLPPPPIALIKAPPGSTVSTHLDTGDQHYADRTGSFTKLPDELLEADWIKAPVQPVCPLEFSLNTPANVWVALGRNSPEPAWLAGWERTSLVLKSNAAPDTTFVIYRKIVSAHSSLTLSSAGTVFVTRILPPATPQFIALDCMATGWTAIGHVKPGVRSEALGQTIDRFPENLTGGDLIMQAADRNQRDNLKFSTHDHVEIVGAFPPVSSIVGNWVDAKQTATTSDGTPYALRRQRVPAGTAVNFAPGDDTPVFAFIRAVRPSVIYTPQALPDGRTEWTIQVGVGDRYGLNFKYCNPAPSTTAISGNLEIVQANGTVLRTDPVSFPGTGIDANWSVVRIRTGESINAGIYKLRMTVPAPLQLSALEVE